MADEDGVEDLVAEPFHAGRLSGGFFQEDLGRAIGGEGLGQPGPGAAGRGDIEDLQPAGHAVEQGIAAGDRDFLIGWDCRHDRS